MNSHIDYIYVTNHPNTFLRRKLLWKTMDYEKIFLDWKTRRTFENEMPESSADSKNDTTKCAGMSDTSERNGRSYQHFVS